jgi:hypothetical protein
MYSASRKGNVSVIAEEFHSGSHGEEEESVE